MPPHDEDPESIARTAQRETLAESASADSELESAFADTAQEIREKLRAEPDNINGVRPTVEQAFQRTSFKRRKIIARVIESGANRGVKASRRTFKLVYGEDVTRAQVRSSKRALNEAADRIAGRVTVDHVSLSKRIRKWDVRLGDEMAREIERGIRSRKGIERIAKRIEKLDNVTEGLPKYLQEVEALARSGSPELKRVVKGYLKRAQAKLGTLVDGKLKASPYSMRSPTQKFLRDLEKAKLDGIDSVVRKYVTERAAWRARVIARSESVNAMRESYVNNAKNKRGVYAFDWKTSHSSHHHPDECDILANQNAYGLGPGRYPPDKVPKAPHPGCLCNPVAVMDTKAFDRQEGGVTAAQEHADHKSPDAVGWLRQRPDQAAAILGPTRHELFKRGVNVLDASGAPLPVRDLLGIHAGRAAE
jgi:hypothetical protein